jgi:drug/metabolite transporter (DMT)-like permease
MAGSALLFALMGVLVKLAAQRYGTGEIVFYRGLFGAVVVAFLVALRGGSLATTRAGAHFWRSACGVVALMLWFFAISGLPLATAMTLNYMSSVWMALFLVGGAVFLGAARVQPALVVAVLVGFAGVALVLQPSADVHSLRHALAGLFSGVIAALAYLQVAALVRSGEPEPRVVFYFALGGVLVGGAFMAVQGASAHTWTGAWQLLGIGALATTAQLMMTRAYTLGHALANAALHYLGIVFALLFGVLWFGELLHRWALLGIALIIAAGLVATRARTQALPAGADSKLPGDAP